MPNASQRQGPLDHLGLADRATTDAEGGARLGARSFTSIIEIRAEWSDALAGDVERLVGVRPPQTSPDVGVGDKCTALDGSKPLVVLSGDDELPSFWCASISQRSVPRRPKSAIICCLNSIW